MCYCFVVHQRAALGHQVGQVHPTVQHQDPHHVPVHLPAVRAVPVLVQVQGLEPSAGMMHVFSGLVHVYHFFCVEHIVQYLLYQHNKSVHRCICVSVYVHIFLNYAFLWRNIYSCCFCPYHYFQGQGGKRFKIIFLLEGMRLESYCSLIHIQTEMMLAQTVVWKRMCCMRMLSQVMRMFMLLTLLCQKKMPGVMMM